MRKPFRRPTDQSATSWRCQQCDSKLNSAHSKLRDKRAVAKSPDCSDCGVCVHTSADARSDSPLMVVATSRTSTRSARSTLTTIFSFALSSGRPIPAHIWTGIRRHTSTLQQYISRFAPRNINTARSPVPRCNHVVSEHHAVHAKHIGILS